MPTTSSGRTSEAHAALIEDLPVTPITAASTMERTTDGTGVNPSTSARESEAK